MWGLLREIEEEIFIVIAKPYKYFFLNRITSKKILCFILSKTESL